MVVQPKLKQVFWVGKLCNCQLCLNSFGTTMYDVRTPWGWANICQSCFDLYGCNLGIGLGQKYTLQEDGKWLLVAGNKE